MMKAVLKLDLHDDKEKKKAMKIASGFAGVESIAMDMKDKKLTVAGGMDPVKLAEKLRKQFTTEIVSVGPAKEEKKDDKKKDGPDDKKKDGPDNKKDDNKGNKNEQSKAPKPDPPPPTVYPFPYEFYRPFPPPPPHYYGYYQPPPPPPTYYYGRFASIEEDPNACVIC